MNTKSFLTVAIVAASFASVADAHQPTPGETLTSFTSAPTLSTALHDMSFKLNKEILAIASDDIAVYRATRERSPFLNEMVSRLAVQAKLSETEVWTELSK